MRHFRVFLAVAVSKASSAAVNARALAFPLDLFLAKLMWNKPLNNRPFNHGRNNLRKEQPEEEEEPPVEKSWMSKPFFVSAHLFLSLGDW